MSASISDQIDAAVATLTADNASMAAALATIQGLLNGIVPGSTVTQATVDALNAAIAGATAQVATAQAEANPAPTPTP